MSGAMTVEEARTVLDPAVVADIESRPRTPLSPWQIVRVAPILRRAVVDLPAETDTAA